MASVHNFTFDKLSRIGDDLCGITERDLQNQAIWFLQYYKLFFSILWYEKTYSFCNIST